MFCKYGIPEDEEEFTNDKEFDIFKSLSFRQPKLFNFNKLLFVIISFSNLRILSSFFLPIKFLKEKRDSKISRKISSSISITLNLITLFRFLFFACSQKKFLFSSFFFFFHNIFQIQAAFSFMM